jgi:hypothetical protein
MLDYLKEFATVFTILFGWLLGLLTPGIAERIRRPYRRRDLMQAVIDELLGLRHTMAVVSWQIRAKRTKVTDSFLDEILPIFENYHGQDRDEEFIAAMRRTRALPEEQRVALHQARRSPDVGIALRQYAIPLLSTQVVDLAICSLEFQRSVLHIRYHLDLYNQVVLYTQSFFDKTFGNLSEENLAAVRTNVEQGYLDAGLRAEIIMHAISGLQKRYAP